MLHLLGLLLLNLFLISRPARVIRSLVGSVKSQVQYPKQSIQQPYVKLGYNFAIRPEKYYFKILIPTHPCQKIPPQHFLFVQKSALRIKYLKIIEKQTFCHQIYLRIISNGVPFGFEVKIYV